MRTITTPAQPSGTVRACCRQGGTRSVLNGLDTTLELTRHAGALKAQGNDFALRQYGWIQLLPARILGADGIVPDVGPDATPPDRDGGLFTV
jgi:hypothetical protein